jgi:hypothetical protein
MYIANDYIFGNKVKNKQKVAFLRLCGPLRSCKVSTLSFMEDELILFT